MEDPLTHIGVIYGDGCQLETVREIWARLEILGFAANCITFGIGAFCFAATIEDGKTIALTRDTYGIAMKAAYGEVKSVKDGDEITDTFYIYKNPKTDTGHLKKSHRGCCMVYKGDNSLVCEDGFYGPVDDEATLLKPVYKNGELLVDYSFMDIRNRMYGDNV